VLRAYHGKGGEVVIPKGVTIIGAYVFAGSAVTKVTIPDSVKTVQEGAFSGCTALKDVRFGKGVTEIGSSAFEEAELTKVTIPGGVKTIDGKKYWSAWSTAKKVKVK